MGEEVTEERLTLTATRLVKEKPVPLAKALDTYCDEGKFFPKPADIIDIMKRQDSTYGMTFA
jgi:hypothetical protein